LADVKNLRNFVVFRAQISMYLRAHGSDISIAAGKQDR